MVCARTGAQAIPLSHKAWVNAITKEYLAQAVCVPNYLSQEGYFPKARRLVCMLVDGDEKREHPMITTTYHLLIVKSLNKTHKENDAFLY